MPEIKPKNSLRTSTTRDVKGIFWIEEKKKEKEETLGAVQVTSQFPFNHALVGGRASGCRRRRR